MNHGADLNLLVGIHIITNNHLDGSRHIIDEHVAIQMKGKGRLDVRRLKYTLETVVVPAKDTENLILLSAANKV